MVTIKAKRAHLASISVSKSVMMKWSVTEQQTVVGPCCLGWGNTLLGERDGVFEGAETMTVGMYCVALTKPPLT